MTKMWWLDAAACRAVQRRFTPHTNARHVHPRDARVRTDFTATRHDYYVDGVLRTAEDHWYSPSGLMRFLWMPFDADGVAARLARISKNPRYAGRTKSEILAIWEKGRLDGQAHHAAEDAWLQHEPLPTGSDALPPPPGFYRAMAELADRGYDVFRTEMTLFDEDARLKGQADLILVHRTTGRKTVADHKHCRVESLRDSNNRSSSSSSSGSSSGMNGIHPWSEYMPDTRQSHYHFQLSLYRWLLLRKYPEFGPLSEEIILINYSPLDASSYEIVALPALNMDSLLPYLPWDRTAAVHQQFPARGRHQFLAPIPDDDPRVLTSRGRTTRARLPLTPLTEDMVWIGHAYRRRGLDQSAWAHPWRWFGPPPYTAPGYYERHLLENLGLLRRLDELVDKVLLCWCRPPEEKCACHVLVKYANLLADGHVTLPNDPMW